MCLVYSNLVLTLSIKVSEVLERVLIRFQNKPRKIGSRSFTSVQMFHTHTHPPRQAGSFLSGRDHSAWAKDPKWERLTAVRVFS